MEEDAYKEYAMAVSETSIVLAIPDSSNKECPIRIKEKPSSLRILYSSTNVRRLIIEMHSVFVKCQQISSPDHPLDAELALEMSSSYRSVLLNAAIANESDEFETDFTFWSFYEVMRFNKMEGSICSDLVSWANQCFLFVQRAVDMAIVELEDGVDLSQGTFWQAVALSLITCRFDLCSTLLSAIVDGSDSAVNVFLDVLSGFRMAYLDKGKESKFDAWKETIRSCLRDNSFSGNDNIVFIAKLLIGEEKHLTTMARRLLKEWWQLLPFYIFTRCPDVTVESLRIIATECQSMMADDESIEDDVFYFVTVFDEISLFKSVARRSWLSVHLVDLTLRSTLDPTLHDIHYYLLSQYATSLIMQSSLWEIGIEYMTECGTEGLLSLENHIEVMYIESDDMADKILDICTKHDLKDSRSWITTTMTNRYLSRGEWSAALGWALRSGEKRIIDSSVQKIVSSSTQEELAALSVLDALPGWSILSLSSLTFLFSLHRFKRVVSNGDSKDCVEHIIPLLVMQEVPPQFQYELFDFLILVIKEDKNLVKFSKELLYELSSFLNTFSLDKEKCVSENYTKKVKELKKLVMLKLAESVVKGYSISV